MDNEVALEVKRNKKEDLLFKVEFENAYDSIYQSFFFLLDFFVINMGFIESWRRYILECLKTLSISIRANGSLTKEFDMNVV